MKMKKEINEKPKYIFDEKRHRHSILVNGVYKSLTGCTTVLGVVAKPALIQWASDMAVGFLGWIKDKKWNEETNRYEAVSKAERLKALGEVFKKIKEMTVEDFLEMLDQARVAHCKRKTDAGEYGDMVHDEVSKLIQEGLDENIGYLITLKHKEKSVQNFIDWAIKNKVKFLATEKNIYSESLFVGGIVDFACWIDDQVFVGDIKTAKSGIYPEHFWQCGCYDLLLKDMGYYWANDIKGYVIVNLKENGKMLEKRSLAGGDNTKAFLACLDIYRIKQKIKNQVI